MPSSPPMSDTSVPPEDTAGVPPEDTGGPVRPNGPAGPEDHSADLDGARKRWAAQLTRIEAETRAAVAREWLPVLDNLDRALEHSSADPAAIIEGVRAVRDQALGVLDRLGFPRREDDQGAAFDPVRHDAVAARDAAGAADGSVVEVVRPGYGEGDHQLRPAQVVVARSG